MREILFRGKLKAENGEFQKGEWVYGDFVTLIDGKEKHLHIYGKGEVKAETVGQYTGLTDKNGTKIFEGDIVKREYTLWHSETKRTRETQIGVVSYSNKECGFCLDKVCNLRKPWDGDTIEIIGNIHDNPEILESEVQGE